MKKVLSYLMAIALIVTSISFVGKLYTYKSTGTGFVTIQAVARGNSDVKSDPLTLYVKDIPATEINY